MRSEEAVQEEMGRDALIVTVLNASTSEQCGQAEQLIIAWMREHPNDFGILDAGEQVAMIMDGYAHEEGRVTAASSAGTAWASPRATA